MIATDRRLLVDVTPPKNPKRKSPGHAPDEHIAEAYARHRNVHKAGQELGICGDAVQRRLVQMGIPRRNPHFTTEDDRRLVAEYAIFRRHGRVAELAAQMGRTRFFLSRRAQMLGLTDYRYERIWQGKWKFMPEEAARAIFDSFKDTPLTLTQFCAKYGYDQLGLYTAIRRRWPDEWEAVIEGKAPLSTWYRRGRQFEYICRDQLKQKGYFVLRSPASRSPIDLVAIRTGHVLFIQCKRHGALPRLEWNNLLELAVSVGAVPVLAETPYPNCTRYWRLTGRKDGSRRRQPMAPFDPGQPETSLQMAL